MSISNAEKLRDAAVGFQELFRERFSALIGSSLSEMACMRANSAGSEEVYAWLAELPAVKEWVDERQVANMRAEGYTLRNLKWESTISVGADEIEDDKLDIIKPRVSNLAEQAAAHYDRLMTQRLVAGFTDLCYDGQALISAAHPRADGGAAQSNTLGAVDLTAANFNTAWSRMASFVDDHGQPLGIVPTHLMYGPAKRAQAMSILVANDVSDGTTTVSNINRGVVQGIMNPYITGNSWYLMSLDRSVKPLILQVRQSPEFVAMDDPTRSDEAFMRDRYLYGVKARHNVGYGMWQLIVGSSGA